jgi:peptidoglycan/xylan/chitin deacetylase (PgdA/CDA1 family)
MTKSKLRKKTHLLNEDGIVFRRCIQNGTIAITFDDGPAPGQTEGVLDLLKAKNITSTFFIIGNPLNNPQGKVTLRLTKAWGHEIGHHSWSHTWPGLVGLENSALLEEMNPLTELFFATIGERPTIMRPPFGAYDDQVLRVVNGELGFKVIIWSLDTNDWMHPGDTAAGLAEYVKALNGTNPATTPGFIALHHDPLQGSKELAETVIDYAQSLGYRFVSLKECLGF